MYYNNTPDKAGTFEGITEFGPLFLELLQQLPQGFIDAKFLGCLFVFFVFLFEELGEQPFVRILEDFPPAVDPQLGPVGRRLLGQVGKLGRQPLVFTALDKVFIQRPKLVHHWEVRLECRRGT